MKRTIAVMTGRAGAGKTTIANYLQANGYERVRFAGPLKDMVAALGLSYDEIDGASKDSPSAKLTWEKSDDLINRIDDAFRAIGFDPYLYDEHEPIAAFGGHTPVYAYATFVHIVLTCIAKGGASGATPRSLMQMVGTEWGRELISDTLWVDLWRARVNELPFGTPVVVDDCRFPNEADAVASVGRRIVFRLTRDTESQLAGAVERGHASEQHVIRFDVVIENNRAPEVVGQAVLDTIHWLSV